MSRNYDEKYDLNNVDRIGMSMTASGIGLSLLEENKKKINEVDKRAPYEYKNSKESTNESNKVKTTLVSKVSQQTTRNNQNSNNVFKDQIIETSARNSIDQVNSQRSKPNEQLLQKNSTDDDEPNMNGQRNLTFTKKTTITEIKNEKRSASNSKKPSTIIYFEDVNNSNSAKEEPGKLSNDFNSSLKRQETTSLKQKNALAIFNNQTEDEIIDTNTIEVEPNVKSVFSKAQNKPTPIPTITTKSIVEPDGPAYNGMSDPNNAFQNFNQFGSSKRFTVREFSKSFLDRKEFLIKNQFQTDEEIQLLKQQIQNLETMNRQLIQTNNNLNINLVKTENEENHLKNQLDFQAKQLEKFFHHCEESKYSMDYEKQMFEMTQKIMTSETKMRKAGREDPIRGNVIQRIIQRNVKHTSTNIYEVNYLDGLKERLDGVIFREKLDFLEASQTIPVHK